MPPVLGAIGAIGSALAPAAGAVGSALGGVGSAIGSGLGAIGGAAGSAIPAAIGLGGQFLGGAGSAIGQANNFLQTNPLGQALGRTLPGMVGQAVSPQSYQPSLIGAQRYSNLSPNQASLLDYTVRNAMQTPQGYQGQFTAGLSPQERQANQMAGQFASSTNQPFGWSSNFINRNLNAPQAGLTSQEQQGLGFLNQYGQGQWGGQQAQGALNQLFANPAAGMSQYEQMGLGALQNYANRGTPQGLQSAQDVLNSLIGGGVSTSPTWQAAQGSILQTLAGQDISKLPAYQAAINQSKMATEDAMQAARQRAQTSGMLTSSPMQAQLARIGMQGADTLTQNLYNMAQQERQNQLAVLPQAIGMAQTQQQLQQNLIPSALQIAQMQEQVPQSTLSALFGYGALPRSIQQTGIQNQMGMLPQMYEMGVAQQQDPLQRAQAMMQYGSLPYDRMAAERGYQTSLLGQAMNLGQLQDARTQQQMQALYGAGGLERGINQADLSARYNDWLNSQAQQRWQTQMGLGVNPYTYQNPQVMYNPEQGQGVTNFFGGLGDAFNSVFGQYGQQGGQQQQVYYPPSQYGMGQVQLPFNYNDLGIVRAF